MLLLLSLAGVDPVGPDGAFAPGAPSGARDVGGAGGEAAAVEVGEPAGGEVGAAAVGVTEGGGVVVVREGAGAAVLGG